MKICIVIPVYNEEAQLESSVHELLTHRKVPRATKIIIADNGSTDTTPVVAERLATRHQRVSVHRLTEKGRGRALRAAWHASDADIVSYMDVDLSTDLEFFPQLVEPLITGKADISTGSRLLRPEWTQRGLKREAISRCYNYLLRVVFGNPFSDAQCGFKAMTRSAATFLLNDVQDNEWFFDTELLLLAQERGLRLFDLPVIWRDDPDSRVRIVDTAIKDLKGVARVWHTRRQRLINYEGFSDHPVYRH